MESVWRLIFLWSFLTSLLGLLDGVSEPVRVILLWLQSGEALSSHLIRVSSWRHVRLVEGPDDGVVEEIMLIELISGLVLRIPVVNTLRLK